MLQKFFTPDLTFMVVAGLAIGITMSAVHAKEDRDEKYGSEDTDKVIQSRQINANQISGKYSMTIDPAAKQQLGEQTFNEVAMFFQTTEKAIETKNMEMLMAQYSDSYRDGDHDKKSIEQAWQRIFARFNTLATLHNMKLVSISSDRNMFVIQCNGLLLGELDSKAGLVTIDNWNKQDHILVKEDGNWKLIGTYGAEQKRLWFDKPMHPIV